MNAHHAVVWIDHNEARIFKFVGESVAEVDVHAKPHAHVHNRKVASGRHDEDEKYYAAVIDALADANEFLVVGPSTAKLHLVKHLTTRHAQLVSRLVGVETVDHPTDGQIVAYAKKYFVAADRMR